MKKMITLAAALLFALAGCSSDDSEDPVPTPAAQSFSFDNNNYTLLSAQAISELKFENVFEAGGVQYDRSGITIIGMNGFTATSTVGFDLYYKHGQSVAGTYQIFNEEQNMDFFEDFVAPLDRGCMGWTSLGTMFNMSTSFEVDSNDPVGTVKIIANSANNYTIQFEGNYRVYNDDFVVVRNVPASINVTGEVYQPN